MNDFDQALLYGFVGGVTFVSMVLLGLHVARSEESQRADDKDAPFAPSQTQSFRSLPVCRVCHKYCGEDRKVVTGQHLLTVPTLCPICAKRAVMTGTPAHS